MATDSCSVMSRWISSDVGVRFFSSISRASSANLPIDKQCKTQSILFDKHQERYVNVSLFQYYNDMTLFGDRATCSHRSVRRRERRIELGRRLIFTTDETHTSRTTRTESKGLGTPPSTPACISLLIRIVCAHFQNVARGIVQNEAVLMICLIFSGESSVVANHPPLQLLLHRTVNACADPCKTRSTKTAGNPDAMAVPAAMTDQTRHDTIVAVLRLTTSTARPATRLKVLNSKVKLNEANNPLDMAKKTTLCFV